MRVVSRLLIVVAGALLLFLLAGISGWLSRHLWVPAVINHQLDGFTLSEMRGLTLARQKNQISAQIDHLRLSSDAGLHINVDDVQLIDLRSILGSLAGSERSSAPLHGRLRLARVTLSAPTIAPQDAQEQVSSEADNPTVISPSMQSGSASSTTTGNDHFSISDTLRALENIPLRGLEIEQLYWADRFDGYLTLSMQNAPGQQISGQILSSRCTECVVTLELNNPADQRPDIQVQLSHAENRVADFDAQLRHTTSEAKKNTQGAWALESHLTLTPHGLTPLFQQLDISLTAAAGSTETIDWNALIQSLKGNIKLALTGEIPNEIVTTADLTNLIATLAVPELSAVLPKEFAGAPLALQYSASTPLRFHVGTISPLAVKSVQGNFTLQVKPETDLPQTTQASPTPLLEANVALTTNKSIPEIQLEGRYDLARLDSLLASTKWKSALGNYTIDALSGRHRFSAKAVLPSLESFTAGNAPAAIENLSVKIVMESPAQFRLSLPQNENPLAALGWKEAQIQVNAKEPLLASADRIPGATTLKISDLKFNATAANKNSGKDPDSVPVLSGTLTNALCSKLPAIECALSIKANLNRMDLANATTASESLTLEASSTIRQPKDTGNTEVAFTNLNLVAGKITSGPATITAPELFTEQASCNFNPQQAECKIPRLALSIAPLALEDNQISGAVFLQDLTLKNTAGKQHGINIQANFHSDNLNVQALGQFKSSVATNGRMALADGLLAGSGRVSTGPLDMDAVWTHSLDTGKGNLTLALPETEFSPNNPLSRGVQGLPIDIVDGTLSVSAHLHWPEKGRDQALLTMKETGLQVDKSFAVGVNTEIKLQQNGNHWVTKDPARVSIKTVDAGVAVNNLHFSLMLAPSGDLTLNSFAAELLEGVLTSDKLTWNLNGEERRSQLQFTGISIGALAREMESQNFAASGLLDAKIPLVTDKQGVTVEDGTIQSRPPGGRLRYYGAFSPAMLGSNPQLKLLAGALEDYNYRDISGTINYPLSGDLKLNLKLTGRSDAIDANRDLIINLNLENNIPTMLRSLQASRDLTDVLEQQVQ